ncbi:PREDICTED: sepiapterin reductase [Ceratosolen solmsi marchali]|uniref:Sepiapterin reductase n=1 Tax=Ceratosolen solmsi marchali TaxID=326594 RepID=A0AAJ6YCX9_9HYME|nr:PREDICTED: sepiapterin reductase [Ceratosolen solmsi marchali]
MTSKMFSGKVFLLVTGASQGIGRKIAEIFASTLEIDSQVLLLARNLENLKEISNQLSKHLTVNVESVDLSKATAKELKDIIVNSLGSKKANQFNEVVIVHNVGSVGNVSQSTVEMTNYDLWTEYYNLNVFGPAVLNGIFMELFQEETIKKHVINITSLCGIQPFKSLGYYCSGKAAREMYFKVFAEEHPNVNVLNYSPGPVETKMFQTIIEDVGDVELKTQFQNKRKNNQVLTTDQTTKRLVEVLSKKNYKSGDHVDYRDEL